jgi:hypothetical protein
MLENGYDLGLTDCLRVPAQSQLLGGIDEKVPHCHSVINGQVDRLAGAVPTARYLRAECLTEGLCHGWIFARQSDRHQNYKYQAGGGKP